MRDLLKELIGSRNVYANSIYSSHQLSTWFIDQYGFALKQHTVPVPQEPLLYSPILSETTVIELRKRFFEGKNLPVRSGANKIWMPRDSSNKVLCEPFIADIYGNIYTPSSYIRGSSFWRGDKLISARIDICGWREKPSHKTMCILPPQHNGDHRMTQVRTYGGKDLVRVYELSQWRNCFYTVFTKDVVNTIKAFNECFIRTADGNYQLRTDKFVVSKDVVDRKLLLNYCLYKKDNRAIQLEMFGPFPQIDLARGSHFQMFLKMNKP